MTNAQLAYIATAAVIKDFKLRGGFSELIARVENWDRVVACVEVEVVKALEKAEQSEKAKEMDFAE